jgi:hypothetical protein
MKKVLFFIALLLTSAIACNKQNFKELQEIPIMKFASEGKVKGSSLDLLTRKDVGYLFSKQRAFNSVPTKVPVDIGVILLDSHYRQIDYYWFLKFNNWFQDLKFENGIMAIDQKENSDCDNFALMYKSMVGVSAYKSGKKSEPAVAAVVVRQKEEFGGIPGSNALHMVNLIFTNNGFFIFEPQTGKKILLENYPNQEYIQYLIL